MKEKTLEIPVWKLNNNKMIKLLMMMRIRLLLYCSKSSMYHRKNEKSTRLESLY